MASAHPILPTQLVGSYPQPRWLVDHDALGRRVPRLRAPEIWRIAPAHLAEAQRDATIAAIHDQERAGLDILTDGEIRRESYSNLFANSLEGVDPIREGKRAVSRAADSVTLPVPLFSGAVRRRAPVTIEDLKFLRAHTTRPIKATLPGPFTMSEQAETTHYRDRESLAMALAAAVNDEVRDLFAAGADIVQLDEPWMQRFPEHARRYGVAAVNRALEGATGTTALHMCFGYAYVVPDKPSSYAFLAELNDCVVNQVSIETAQPRLDLAVLAELPAKTIVLGVLDLGDDQVESAATIAKRIEAALKHVAPDRLAIAPDCGMKYLPREVAFGKMCAMVAGARLIRAGFGAD